MNTTPGPEEGGAGARYQLVPVLTTVASQERHTPDRGPPDPPVRPPGHAAPPIANSPASTHWLFGALAPANKTL